MTPSECSGSPPTRPSQGEAPCGGTVVLSLCGWMAVGGMGRGVCGWGWRELGGQKLGERVTLLLGEGKPQEIGCGWDLKGGAGGGQERCGGWLRAAGGGDQSSGCSSQPRVCRGSHPPLSSDNEELFQLKAPGAWPAAAAAPASLQQGPREPLCPLAAWPEVS